MTLKFWVFTKHSTFTISMAYRVPFECSVRILLLTKLFLFFSWQNQVYMKKLTTLYVCNRKCYYCVPSIIQTCYWDLCLITDLINQHKVHQVHICTVILNAMNTTVIFMQDIFHSH